MDRRENFKKVGGPARVILLIKVVNVPGSMLVTVGF